MLLLLGGFLLLMLLGLPVALSMATSSLVYILVTGITPDVTLAQRMIAGVESFDYRKADWDRIQAIK